MKKKIFFQGEHGAYSEEAAFEFFGNSILCEPRKTFEDVFQSVRKEKNSFGIIPIENTLAGSLYINYDLLLKFDLKIVGELNKRISHHLIGLKNSKMNEIRKIYSHPIAIQQCQKFIRSRKKIEIIETYDTAGSVMMIKNAGLIDCAAIASQSSAKIYGVKILEKNIGDFKQNFTRFLILSNHKMDKSKGSSKTSIVFSLKNEPGILFKVLSVFALRGIDLTKIESRPLREKPFEYYFYLDFIGSIEDENCKRALNHLKEVVDYLKVLGSYRLIRY